MSSRLLHASIPGVFICNHTAPKWAIMLPRILGDYDLLYCRRDRGKRPFRPLLFSTFLSLCGCATSYPQDVRLLSVTPSRSNDIPGFPYHPSNEPTLKLTFQSAFDLAAYTRDSYGTGVSAKFCDEAVRFRDYPGSPAPSLAWSTLYADNGQPIEPATFAPDLPEGVDRTRFYAFLFVSRPPPPPGPWSHPDHSWDLRANPHDVCVRIGTLKVWPLLGSRSEVMHIPAAVLRAALGPPTQ